MKSKPVPDDPVPEGERAAIEALAAMAAEADRFEQAAGGPVTEIVARWLAPTYAAAVRKRLEALDEERRFEALRACIHDLGLLRQGDQGAARLRFARERFDWEKEQAGAAIEARFEEKLRDPAVRNRYLREQLGEQERARQMRLLFGMGMEPRGPDPRPGLSDETLDYLEKALKIL